MLTGAAVAAWDYVLAGAPEQAPGYAVTDHWWGMTIDIDKCIDIDNRIDIDVLITTTLSRNYIFFVTKPTGPFGGTKPKMLNRKIYEGKLW